MLALAMLVVANLLESREGRAIRSLRGGAVMVESLGINVFRIRLITFVIAALLGRDLRLALCAYEPRSSAPRLSMSAWASSICSWRYLADRGKSWVRWSGSVVLTMLTNALAGHPAAFLQQWRTTCKSIVFAVLYVLALQFARGGVMPLVLKFLPGRSKPPLAAAAEPLPRRQMPEAGTPAVGGRPPDQAFRRP